MTWAAGQLVAAGRPFDAGRLVAAAESYEAGPTALLIIALLGVGIYLLGRSMVKHLRRVPASFDPPDERRAEPGAGAGDPGETAGPEVPGSAAGR